jgi:hypothetical protein
MQQAALGVTRWRLALFSSLQANQPARPSLGKVVSREKDECPPPDAKHNLT